MPKITHFVTFCFVLLLAGCGGSSPVSQTEGFPKTYQNFVNCSEQKLDIPQGEEVQLKGTVKLKKEVEGTPNEWSYYVLDTGDKEYILSGGSGWGVPDYNYGNSQVNPLVNTEIEVKGVLVTIDSYKNSDEEQFAGKTDEGVFLTEINGYYAMCCNAGVEDIEAEVFKKEAEKYRAQIEDVNLLVKDANDTRCALMKLDDVEECRRRLLNAWRTRLKQYEYVALNKHTPEQQCFWADPYNN